MRACEMGDFVGRLGQGSTDLCKKADRKHFQLNLLMFAAGVGTQPEIIHTEGHGCS